MTDYLAIAEYESLADAKVGLEVLEKSHFTPDEVSLLTRPGDARWEDLNAITDQESNAPTGTSTGLGMMIGGGIAAPFALGTMIGPFMVVGPLVGLLVGAGLGGMFEATNIQTKEDLTKDYERRLQAGSVLIVVTADNKVRLDDAVNPLKTTGPKSLERFEA